MNSALLSEKRHSCSDSKNFLKHKPLVAETPYTHKGKNNIVTSTFSPNQSQGSLQIKVRVSLIVRFPRSPKTRRKI